MPVCVLICVRVLISLCVCVIMPVCVLICVCIRVCRTWNSGTISAVRCLIRPAAWSLMPLSAPALVSTVKQGSSHQGSQGSSWNTWTRPPLVTSSVRPQRAKVRGQPVAVSPASFVFYVYVQTLRSGPWVRSCCAVHPSSSSSPRMTQYRAGHEWSEGKRRKDEGAQGLGNLKEWEKNLNSFFSTCFLTARESVQFKVHIRVFLQIQISIRDHWSQGLIVAICWWTRGWQLWIAQGTNTCCSHTHSRTYLLTHTHTHTHKPFLSCLFSYQLITWVQSILPYLVFLSWLSMEMRSWAQCLRGANEKAVFTFPCKRNINKYQGDE